MIGRVIGTEKNPNSAYSFGFWAKPEEAHIGIGTLVKVVGPPIGEHPATFVYGVVVEALGYNDVESPLHEFLAVGGDAAVVPPTERPEIRFYRADVLRRVPEEPIGAVPIGEVHLADAADVAAGLNTDSYAAERGIPCGCYRVRDEMLPVHLHADFLLGPEAGHLNVTGTSGLAAKTSYVLFLLKSIFASSEASRVGSVATLLFNTKGSDLLYLDHRSSGLPEEDRRLYEACGIEPDPFPEVRYFAPRRATGELATLRNHPEVEGRNPTRPISFGLADFIRHIEVLLSRDDIDSKADAYLQYLSKNFVARSNHLIRRDPGSPTVGPARTLGDLTGIVQRQLDFAEEKGLASIDTHNPLTVRKMLNRLEGLTSRFPGLIAPEVGPEGPLDDPFEPGTVTVIDVSQIGGQAQEMVFAAVVTKLQERMESRNLGADHLVVVVDELNKYAPSTGSDNYVVYALKDIAARGRYMGLTLFGAQQFKSRVEKEVVGNAATHAFGHIEAEEMAQPGYSWLPESVREKLRTLGPGEMLVKHPFFKQPIFLRFPRPCWMNGSDGARAFPAQAPQGVAAAIRSLATRMGVPDAEVADILARSTDVEERLVRCLQLLQKGGGRAEALRALNALPKRLVAPSADGREPVAGLSDIDPFE